MLFRSYSFGFEATQTTGVTHKWMISITTASYVCIFSAQVNARIDLDFKSLHASTVLKKVTVTCGTDPPPSAFVNPISVSEPPFCLMGSTDKPFLARITLEWAGEDRNKPTQIDHWIEVSVQNVHGRQSLTY